SVNALCLSGFELVIVAILPSISRLTLPLMRADSFGGWSRDRVSRLVRAVGTPHPAGCCGAAAVHEERDAGDVAGQVAGEEQGGPGAIVLVAPAERQLGRVLLAAA